MNDDVAADDDAVVDAPAPPARPDATEPERPEEPWITRQPRMEELRRLTPAELEWSPATTEWGPSRRPIPDMLTEAHVREHGGPRSPGDAMAALARATYVLDELHIEGRQEVTIRAAGEPDERAIGVLLYWGALDDAVAGWDLRASLGSVDGAWYIEGLEERFHCRRGIADGLCV